MLFKINTEFWTIFYLLTEMQKKYLYLASQI